MQRIIVIALCLCLAGAEQICTPGTTWKEECNSCFCTPGGIPGCTKKMCPAGIEPIMRSRADKPDAVCQKGDTWKEDCNSCWCVDGQAACTMMLCPPKVHAKRRRDAEDFSCTPGESFKMDCNHCICGKDGRMAACTLMGCPQARQRSAPTCTPGESFKVSCNTCICGNDATSAACTLMACPEDQHH